ncbi:MAG TPA: heterocyst development glycosyltransferase HepC [Coleofasciculaceae cyanobacterium]
MTVLTQLISSIHQQQNEKLTPQPQCQLLWRQGQLLVKSSQDTKPIDLLRLEDEQWLVQCLQNSPVRLVKLDSNLGEAVLKRWVNACEQANKPVFLWGHVARKPSRNLSPLGRYVKRSLDGIATLLLLLVLSPLMLGLVGLMYFYSPGAIFSYTWQVGTRGKVFRAVKFRTTAVHDEFCLTPLGRWMSKYRLDELPRLLNVLRGEMSLGESRPLSLSEAVQLCLETSNLTIG